MGHLWGSLASCAPVVYRRNWRVANPPQDTILPRLPSGPYTYTLRTRALMLQRML
jgi:hypothetical protein